MKKNLFIALFSMALIAQMFQSVAAKETFVSLDSSDIDRLEAKYNSVRIEKENNQYQLSYIASALLDENGKALVKTSHRYMNVRRIIKIPVKIALKADVDFGGKIQVWGEGDDDVKTGNFKNISHLNLGDLFTDYEGFSGNLGLVLVGGGYTTLKAANGASLKEVNGSILFIGPAGTPVGINAGIEYFSFKLNISPLVQRVKVLDEVAFYQNGKLLKIVNIESVKTVDSLRSISLKAN